MITNAHSDLISRITLDLHAILIGALALLLVIIAFFLYRATVSKKRE